MGGKARRLLEARDENGWTALHVAAFRGMFTMCEVLLRSGASREARSFNWTAYDSAVANKMMAVANLLKNWGKPSALRNSRTFHSKKNQNQNRKKNKGHGKRFKAIQSNPIGTKNSGKFRNKRRSNRNNKGHSNQISSNRVEAKEKVVSSGNRPIRNRQDRRINNHSNVKYKGRRNFPVKKTRPQGVEKRRTLKKVEMNNKMSQKVEKNKQSNKNAVSEGLKAKGGRRYRRGNKPRSKWNQHRNRNRGRRNNSSDQQFEGGNHKRIRRQKSPRQPVEHNDVLKAKVSRLNPFAKEFKPSNYQAA